MKKLLPFVVAAMFATGAVQARNFDVCDIESDYDMKVESSGLTFTRNAGAPEKVEMRGGRLFLDGKEQALSQADARRIATFEAKLRALIPQVKGIALEAVGIATEAVVQVAAAFSGAEPRDMDKLERLSSKISHRIEMSDDTAEWRDDEFDAAVEELTAELVPMIVGDIASAAVAAAFSGDESKVAEIEARAEKLDREIEKRVEVRADALELQAKALCPHVVDLDRIESELELRLADGSALDLVRTDND